MGLKFNDIVNIGDVVKLVDGKKYTSTRKKVKDGKIGRRLDLIVESVYHSNNRVWSVWVSSPWSGSDIHLYYDEIEKK